MQVNNNQFELKPEFCKKRKYSAPRPNVYMNPALDILANEDPVFNNAMEVIPQKKRKRTKSCSEAVFENSALDLGTKQTLFNEFLVTELGNVTKSLMKNDKNRSVEDLKSVNHPVYVNIQELRNFKPNLGKSVAFVNKRNCRLPLMPSDVEKFDNMDFTIGDMTLSDTNPVHSEVITDQAQIIMHSNSFDENLPRVIEINENISNVDKSSFQVSLPPFMPNVSEIPKIDITINSNSLVRPETCVQTMSLSNVEGPSLPKASSQNENDIDTVSQAEEVSHKIEVGDANDESMPNITMKSANLKLSDSPVTNHNQIALMDAIPNSTNLSNNPFESYNTTAMQNIQCTSHTNHIFINNQTNLSLSFIDKLDIDSPSVSGQSLYLDDDLNESNIMEIKTITIITKKRRNSTRKSTNPFLNHSLDEAVLTSATENPFLSNEESYKDSIADYEEAGTSKKKISKLDLVPKRLFDNETDASISNVCSTENLEMSEDEEMINHSHIYENVDSMRAESPVYANVTEDLVTESLKKQSKILGCDISQFNGTDIMNFPNTSANSNDNSETKKEKKNPFLNKLSKKVFKKIKKTFKGDKIEQNTTLNPYEVPRKPLKNKKEQKEQGLENPALKLDWSDEIEIEEIDNDEHQYETIKTARNTRNNMKVTPLKERTNQFFDYVAPAMSTPGKKQVRFDSTLNKEKIITGNSFDQTQCEDPGLDTVIDEFHDELENCINEKKFIAFNTM